MHVSDAPPVSDPTGDDTEVLAAGQTPYEMVEVTALDVIVGRYAYLPRSVQAALLAEQKASPSTFHLNPNASWLADVLGSADDDGQQARLALARPFFA